MKWIPIVLAAGCGALALQAQEREPRQVLRIGVDLVQVDATVTDARGRHVSDLTMEDFEILQDGRPQKIATFAYIRNVPAAPSAGGATAAVRPATPAPALKPDQVRRTIAVIVDDLGLSFESTYRAREVLRHFLDKQMQRGDLVAILRTGAGSGALQQFTSDRRVLDAAVERVRWNMMARVAPFSAGGEAEQGMERSRNELFTAGTLGAIDYVIRGIGSLPGRKSVIVLSDGFRLVDADGTYGRVSDALRGLVDAANRAGVVLYTIDMRGLMTTGPSAEDTAPEQTEARREELSATQDGLHVLAHETGGLFLRNSNDLAAGVQRALDDQQGYYLLGYAPDQSTFGAGRPRFHRLSVRLKRPGLRVRSRRGFLGVPDRATPPPTPVNRMVGAVTSPFAGGDVRLRLTSFFGHDEKLGAVVLSVMHVDTRDLTFTAQPDGTQSAEVETLAVTFDEDGRVADQNSRRYTFNMPADVHARSLAHGLVYRIRVPIKRPGPYQLRIALRDVGGDKIGSASHFIDVPDLKKKRLTLSGLVVEGSKRRSELGADNTVDAGDPGATVAMRTFRQGTEATYFSEIYNAQRGRDGQPQVESSTRLYRDGVEVFKSEPRAVHPLQDPKRPPIAAGLLQFGPGMTPGSYLLELTVVDKLAKKNNRATQTIDFEVIR